MKSSPDSGAALERKLMKGVERLLRGLDPGLTLSPIIVAVSGGTDSLALLLLLTHLKETLGLTLHVAHLDHGLRGRKSQETMRSSWRRLPAISACPRLWAKRT